MSVRLYFDVHVPIAIAESLRLRDVDVLRAQDDGTAELEDPRLRIVRPNWTVSYSLKTRVF